MHSKNEAPGLVGGQSGRGVHLSLRVDNELRPDPESLRLAHNPLPRVRDAPRHSPEDSQPLRLNRAQAGEGEQRTCEQQGKSTHPEQWSAGKTR